MLHSLLRAAPAAVAIAIGATGAAIAQVQIQFNGDAIDVPVPATLALLGAAIGGKFLIDFVRGRRRGE